MGEYVLIYLMAFMLSVFLVPWIRRLALRVGAVDQPDSVRKIHSQAMPRMGGVAIYIASVVPVVLACLVAYFWFHRTRVYHAVWPPALPGALPEENLLKLVGLLCAATLVLAVGIYDDVKQARPRTKVLVQIVAGLILCFVGIKIDHIGNPFGGETIQFGWYAWPLTIFWVVAITNAINLIDGMDGLGPGVGLFVAGTMFMIAIVEDVMLAGLVMSGLVGAIIGFLIFNFHPAKVFMGDSGSLFIGFLLAAISMMGSMKSGTIIALLVPLVALGLPIVDTMLAVARRWAKGLPMSVADKQHVHHRLMKLGFSQREAVLVLYGVSVLLGCGALVMAMAKSALVSIAVTGGIFVAIIVGIHLVGGREFSALGARIKKRWRERQKRRSLWVTLYKTAAKLEQADDVEQAWKDTTELFEKFDLDTVTLKVEGSELPGGDFTWSVSGNGMPDPETSGDFEGWTARLFLSDNDRVLGRLDFTKDARRSPMSDTLCEMINVFRDEVTKTLVRLREEQESESSTESQRLPS